MKMRLETVCLGEERAEDVDKIYLLFFLNYNKSFVEL
jgi:hypothetical protein